MSKTLEAELESAAVDRVNMLALANANFAVSNGLASNEAQSEPPTVASNRDAADPRDIGRTLAVPVGGISSHPDVSLSGIVPRPSASGCQGSQAAAEYVELRGGQVRRGLLALIGIFFVALGGIGVVLPGVPTVGPLLLASFLFAKSYPPLEQKLIKVRFFARFSGYLDGTEVMSVRARLRSIGLMWSSIAISSALLAVARESIPWVLISSIAAAGLVGTFFIWRFRRELR